MKFIRKKINESVGFENPFEDTVTDTLSPMEDQAIISDPLDMDPKKTKVSISGVKLWNTNTANKTVYKNKKMYAGQYFCAGDIVEVSPVKILTDKDMYSENIRESSFVIDKGKGIYALPLGYALCYRNSMEIPYLSEGNISYDFNLDTNEITFTAIKDIRKGEELVIDATEDDFANEIQPGQFQYKQGPDPIYSTKNIKIV